MLTTVIYDPAGQHEYLAAKLPAHWRLRH